MKQFKSAAAVVIVLILSVQVFAGQKNSVNSNVEKNLVIGLQSDNLGLKTSSAYLLGEIGTSSSVIALMKVLKSGNTEEERISAALALTKINTDKAMFAVKQRAKYDESERVRRCCSMLYQQNVMDKART